MAPEAVKFLIGGQAPPLGVAVYAEKRCWDPEAWAVTYLGDCLNHDGKWESEPMPSSRTPEFLGRTRWPTMEAALEAYRRVP